MMVSGQPGMLRGIFVTLTLLAAAASPGKGHQLGRWLFGQFLDNRPGTEAEAAGLVAHPIDDVGQCYVFAKRGVRWSKDFADGSRLELRCNPDRGILRPGFRLWYSDGKGIRAEIARCVFDEGFNKGWYYTWPDRPGLAMVKWVNVDGGKNDGGLRRLDRDHRTGPEEPYVDAVTWVYDVARHRLECTSDKYQYLSESHRLPSSPEVPLDSYVGDLVPELSRSFVKFLGQ